MRLTDAELRGKKVIDADGVALGHVAAILLEMDDLSIHGIRVKLFSDVASRVGAHRSLLHAPTVDIAMPAIQSIGDAIVLRMNSEQLRSFGESAEHAAQPH